MPPKNNKHYKTSAARFMSHDSIPSTHPAWLFLHLAPALPLSNFLANSIRHVLIFGKAIPCALGNLHHLARDNVQRVISRMAETVAPRAFIRLGAAYRAAYTHMSTAFRAAHWAESFCWSIPPIVGVIQSLIIALLTL